MSAPDTNSPFNDPSYTRERLELETRVLAAALRQSLEIGDTEGSSLAHEQIFLLLKASQEMVIDEPLNLPSEVFIDRGRQLPDIDWGSAPETGAESGPIAAADTQSGQEVAPGDGQQQAQPGHEVNFAPPDETAAQAVREPEAAANEVFDQASSSEVVEMVEAVVQEVVHELKAGDSADEVGEHAVEIATETAVEPPAEAHSVAADQAAAGAAVQTAVQAARDAVGHIDPAVVDQAKTTVEQEPVAVSVSESSESGEKGEEAEDSEKVESRPLNDYYSQLKVTDLADFPSIHQSFWRMLRPLLRAEVGLIGPERLPHLRNIQKLWIAHDILCDPVTRADYDFRRMGLRGGEEDEAGRHARKTSGQRTQLRIGELLQCAGLLEQTELDIAADMHKAMPEMMFGTFLVKQGFIEEADLDCVLIGQQLLKSGDITVVQFQTVMVERSATGLDIGEMLLAKGYVNQTMLERAYRNQSEDTLVKVPIVVASGQKTTMEGKPPGHHEAKEEAVQAVAKTVADEAANAAANAAADAAANEAANAAASEAANAAANETAQPIAANPNLVSERSLNLGHAAPAWKDQLDWSSPEAEATTVDVAAEVSDAPLETEPPPAPNDYVKSKWSAPNVVSAEQDGAVVPPAPLAPPLVASEMNDALAESVRAIAQIWAEEPNPVSIWARLPAAGEGPPQSPPDAPPEATLLSPPGAQLDAPPEAPSESPLEARPEARPEAHSDSSAAHAQMAQHGSGDRALPEEVTTGPLHTVSDDAGAHKPLPVESAQDMRGNPFVADSDAHSDADSPVITDPSLAPIDSDDTVSEIETSSQLPSLGQLELQAKAKEKQKEHEAKRGTGDWQIMSVPGSALTSLFLDDEPEAPRQESTSAREVTGNMGAFTDDIEAQYQTGAKKAQEVAPTAPSKDEKAGGDQPPDNESRKARRRRTRH